MDLTGTPGGARQPNGVAQEIEAAQGGCGESYGQLAERCRAYLLHVATRELGDDLRAKIGASDLVQETLLQGQQAVERFRGRTEDELRAWLRQILLHNLARSHRFYRATSKRDVGRERPLDAADGGERFAQQLPADLSTPSKELMAEERVVALRQAIERLSAVHRQVIILRNVEHHSFVTIGRMLAAHRRPPANCGRGPFFPCDRKWLPTMVRDEIKGDSAADHAEGTSPPDDDHEASQVEALLLAFDEGLANGSTADAFDLTSVPPELSAELRGAQDCLWLLHAASRAGQLDDLAPSTAARQSAEPATLESIERIGRFTIVRELGRGGHGIVFLAIDPNLGRRVALKVPRPEALITPDLRRRFLREAEAAGSLRHGNLVTVYEAGEDGPLCYLAIEYCDGPTLAQWLKEHCDAVSPRLAAEFVAMLAAGVEHAHSLGVLHRDIKPSNVLLEPLAMVRPDDALAAPLLSTFTPKLTDFGLAKLMERQDDETRGGALLGTPAYMAPEQAAGRMRDVGVATDVYGLGVLLYEVLTGRAPFRGESDPDTLRRVCIDEPLLPSVLRPGLSRDLEAICLKCLEKKPARRYAAAAELVEDLRRYLRRRADPGASTPIA